MGLTLTGADYEAAGSYHFLEVGNIEVPIDCSMEQGNNTHQDTELSVGYHEIDYVLLTHAHTDHAGMPPWIHAGGFRGQVITTHATADLCSIVPKNGAHIQEVEAEQKNQEARRASRGEVEAFYTMQDAEGVLKHFEGVAYGQVFKLNDNLTLRFTDVGHLLGSVSIEIWATEGASRKRIAFSGDIGNRDKSLIRDPRYITEADYVVMRSTYGDRYYKKGINHVGSLARIIQGAPDRQGNVVIPAFAVRYTQELLYLIRHIKEEKPVAGHGSLEVYVDNPLVVEATHVLKDSMLECYDEETKILVERGINPTDFPGPKLSIASKESKNISSNTTSKVIVSTAGMCDAGRIRHHLKHNLWRPECFVVFAGYQVEGTLGWILWDGAQTVKIFDEEIDVRAHIETMDGISGYMDRGGLISRISALERKSDYVLMTHGSRESCVSFSDVLSTQLKLTIRAPFSSSQFDLIKGFQIKEIEDVLIEKETAAGHRASGVYIGLVDAGKMLLDVIHCSEGGANEDLTHFTERVLALCDKWGRWNVTDRRY